MGTLPTLSDAAYRIESELGVGGGGVVYKAWHTRLEKYVVLKRIKDDSSLLGEERRRGETDILKNLKHSHLPQLYDFLVEPGGVYTVMEYIPGESFDHLLKAGKVFTQQQIVRWAEQLSDALAYLHAQNPPVLHSDIKPGNIMLTPEGNVCLIDFNISLVLDGEDATALGLSHGYASPEQYGPQALPSDMQIAPNSKSIAPLPRKTSAAEAVTEIEKDGAATELEPDSAATELSAAADAIDPGSSTRRLAKIRMDTRSDIYSLGATLYHLATGEKPAIATGDILPLNSGKRHFSEGFIYTIERCMERDPSARFQTAAELLQVIRNIHKHDTRWKAAQAKRLAAAILLPTAFALFAGTSFWGFNVMAQETEERYYDAVVAIEKGSDPEESYQEALSIYWDRIDPYRAMAKRLWDEGDMEACRTYIEENLGNIAKFQSVPEAARSYGDIYYILGGCYYEDPTEPDYHMAKENFAIAVRYVTDNPLIYRDYAVALARSGDVLKAEDALEEAESLELEDDSLNLLQGEIHFAKGEYEDALAGFEKVITLTEDDYLRYRAYHTADEIYKLLGQPEQSVALLTDALDRIPLNRVPEMTERLADAYVKSGDYDNALLLFEQLAENGVLQFHILQDLVILTHTAGDFDRAEELLNRMDDLYPNDYRVPMRRAYLEADRQSTIKNEMRDYTLTKQYYDSAVLLYNENVKPGEADPEMQQLDLIIEQLRQNQWID